MLSPAEIALAHERRRLKGIAATRDWQARNVEHVRSVRYKRALQLQRLWKEFMRGRVCKHCGSEENLVWHHRDPATKLFNVSARKYTAQGQAAAECDKCDILCYACHIKLHAELIRQQTELLIGAACVKP